MPFCKVRRVATCSLFVGILVSSIASSSTVIAVTDPVVPIARGALFLGGQFSNDVAASWTQSASFSSISIDATLATSDPAFRTGTAYLTSALGSTATPADVIASAPFTAPVGVIGTENVTPTVLFSGLSLGPGTYYLVLSAPFRSQTVGSDLSWAYVAAPVIATDPSVVYNSAFVANTSFTTVDSFAPASPFIADAENFPLFEVSTPEPSMVGMLLLALGLFALLRYRFSAPDLG
jgi:PEP-CTERM motif